MPLIDNLLETMIQDQLDKFIVENNLIPENMHGTSKAHTIVTAKVQWMKK